jgi:hypothetical protein
MLFTIAHYLYRYYIHRKILIFSIINLSKSVVKKIQNLVWCKNSIAKTQYFSILLQLQKNCAKNTRPDCDDLARQGWCTRNAHWMRENCAPACGFCIPNTNIPNNNNNNNKPPSTPSPQTAGEVCEDLRVDCAELAKRRYCITARYFTKTYCARSCGFCFAPPATEAPETVTQSPPPGDSRSGNGGKGNGGNTESPPAAPLVTFWPIIRFA